MTGGNGAESKQASSVDEGQRSSLLYTLNSLLYTLKSIAIQNPTLVLSLIYAQVTLTGILYSWALYRQFGINIFDFANVSDFLLAALKNPSVIFVVTTVLFIAPMGLWMYRFLTRDLEAERTASERHSFRTQLFLRIREQSANMVIMTAFLVLTFVEVVPSYVAAVVEAGAIKRSEHPFVEVRYKAASSSADQVTESGLVLIGATTTTAFFYDEAAKHTLVIPQAQLIAIEVPQ